MKEDRIFAAILYLFILSKLDAYYISNLSLNVKRSRYLFFTLHELGDICKRFDKHFVCLQVTYLYKLHLYNLKAYLYLKYLKILNASTIYKYAILHCICVTFANLLLNVVLQMYLNMLKSSLLKF